MQQSSYTDSSHDDTPLLYLPRLQNSTEDPDFHHVLLNYNKDYFQKNIKQEPNLQQQTSYKQSEESGFFSPLEEVSSNKESSLLTNTIKPIYPQVKLQTLDEESPILSQERSRTKKMDETLYRKIDSNSEMEIIIKDKTIKLTIIQNKSEDGSDINDLLMGTEKEIQALLDVFEVKVAQSNMGGYLKGIFFDIEALFTHIKLTDSLQFNAITHKHPIILIESPTNTIVESNAYEEYAIIEYYLNFYVNQVLPGKRMVKRFCGLKLNKLNITKEIREKLKLKKWRYMERNIKCMGKKLQHVVNDLDKCKDENNQLKDKIKLLKKQLEEKERNKGRIIPLMTESQKSQEGSSVTTQKCKPFWHNFSEKPMIQRQEGSKRQNNTLVKLETIHDSMSQRRSIKQNSHQESEPEKTSQKNPKAQEQADQVCTDNSNNQPNLIVAPKPTQGSNSQELKKRPKTFKSIFEIHRPNKIQFFSSDSYEKLAEYVAAVSVPCQSLTVRFQSTTSVIVRSTNSSMIEQIYQQARKLGLQEYGDQECDSKNILIQFGPIKNLAEAIKHNPNITQHTISLTMQHSHMLGCHSKFFDSLIEAVNKHMTKLQRIIVVYPHDKKYCLGRHWTAYVNKNIIVKLMANFTYSA